MEFSTPVDNSVHYFHSPVRCAVGESKIRGFPGVSLPSFGGAFE